MISAVEALALSDWYARYALDRLPDPPRHLHPAVRSHLQAATGQLILAVQYAEPAHDQREIT